MCVLLHFELPQLMHLVLCLRDMPGPEYADDGCEEVVMAFLRITTPVLRAITLEAQSCDDAWPPGLVRSFSSCLAFLPQDPPIQLRTNWLASASLQASAATISGAMAEVTRLGNWVADLAKFVQQTGDERAAKRVIEAVKGVAELQDFVEE